MSAGSFLRHRTLTTIDYHPQRELLRLQARDPLMLEYRDKPGPGRDTVMTNALRGFNNQQLDDMAHFLAHFGKSP